MYVSYFADPSTKLFMSAVHPRAHQLNSTCYRCYLVHADVLLVNFLVVFALVLVLVQCTCTVPVSYLLWLAVTGVYLSLNTLFAICMRLNDIRDGIALLHFVRDVVCSALLLSSGLCLSVRSLSVIICSNSSINLLHSTAFVVQYLYEYAVYVLYSYVLDGYNYKHSYYECIVYCSSSISLHFASCSYRSSTSSRIASHRIVNH